MDRYGPLVLRLVVGATFAAHGAQKLFGVWGGAGLAGTGAYLDSLGLSPGYPLAVAVALTQFAGGLLLIAGLVTGYVTVLLAFTVLGAMWNVHLAHGFFINWGSVAGRGHGVEYHLVSLAALFCLALTGPGAFSIEHRRARSAEADAAGRARLLRKL